MSTNLTHPKEQTKAAYDRMSRWYDLFAGFEAKPRNAGIEKLNPAAGEIILEVGVGTGRSLLALAEAVGSSGMIYGLDLSPGMLAVSRSKLEKAALSGRVVLECEDAAQLSFDDNFFDGVFMSFTLELFDPAEIPIVLINCRRALRHGGRICVVAMSAEDKPNMITRIYEWLHVRVPAYVDCRPIPVQEFLCNAGFRIVDVTDLSLFGISNAIVLAEKA